MSEKVELPELWLIIEPDGSIDGYIRARLSNGRVLATADLAHRYVTRLKREREREIRDGVTIRGGTFAEWNNRAVVEKALT